MQQVIIVHLLVPTMQGRHQILRIRHSSIISRNSRDAAVLMSNSSSTTNSTVNSTRISISNSSSSSMLLVSTTKVARHQVVRSTQRAVSTRRMRVSSTQAHRPSLRSAATAIVRRRANNSRIRRRHRRAITARVATRISNNSTAVATRNSSSQRARIHSRRSQATAHISITQAARSGRTANSRRRMGNMDTAAAGPAPVGQAAVKMCPCRTCLVIKCLATTEGSVHTV